MTSLFDAEVYILHSLILEIGKFLEYQGESFRLLHPELVDAYSSACLVHSVAINKVLEGGSK